jgi:hypothetical protein
MIVTLSVCLFLHLPTYLPTSVLFPICPFVHLSICPSVHLSLSLSVQIKNFKNMYILSSKGIMDLRILTDQAIRYTLKFHTFYVTMISLEIKLSENLTIILILNYSLIF